MKRMLKAVGWGLKGLMVLAMIWLLFGPVPKLQAAEQMPAVVSISTKEPGSTSYATNIPIAAVVSKYVGFKFSVEPVGDFDKSAAYLQRGEIQMVSSSSEEMLANFTGTWGVREAKPWIRMVLNHYEAPYVWFTQGDSGINSFKDIEGKKVACYVPGQPHFGWFTDQLIKRYGVKNVRQVRVPNATASGTELIEGRADVGTSTVSPRLMDVEKSPRGMKLIPITKEDVDFVNEQAGFGICEFQSIPAGYIGLKSFAQGWKTLGVRAAWGAHKDVSEEVIYRLVKTTYEHYDEYKNAYPRCAAFTLENALKTFPTPYHPGAIKYFKEKGVWTADHEKTQQKLLSQLKK